MRIRADNCSRMRCRIITGMKRACYIFFIAAAMLAQQPIRPVPPLGIEVAAQDRSELESGLQRLRAAIDKLRGESAAAGCAHLSRSGPLRAPVQRILSARRDRESQNPAAKR